MDLTRTFTIVLEPEQEGGFTVRVPALPEIVTEMTSRTLWRRQRMPFSWFSRTEPLAATLSQTLKRHVSAK